MLPKALCILLLLLTGAGRAQSPQPSWTGLHRIYLHTTQAIDTVKKSTAEITVYADPAMRSEGFSGFCGIELHGNSTLGAPKKSYDIELRSSLGEEQMASLLGMAPGDDFVLLSSYYDRSFLRNALAFELARSLGSYAPAYRFCELYINTEFQGLYLLTEKIKVDSNRVNLGTPSQGGLTGNWVTPPFLLRFDWKDDKSYALGGSLSNAYLHYRLDYPKSSDLGGSHYRYQNFLNELDHRFHRAMKDGRGDFEYLIDMTSFADFFLINELAKNPDGLKASAYFYREYASVSNPSPPLKAGPLWDFDLAFDNMAYAHYNEVEGWGFEEFGPMSHVQLLPVWWHVLRCNPEFRQRCVERFEVLRAQFASKEFAEFVRTASLYISPAVARDAALWAPTREEFVNDWGPIRRTASEDVERILAFTRQRMEWMTEALQSAHCFSPLAAQRAVCSTLTVYSTDKILRFPLWEDSVQLPVSRSFQCSVLSRNGLPVVEDWVWKSSDRWMTIDASDWPPGEYFLEVYSGEAWLFPIRNDQPVTSYQPTPRGHSAANQVPQPQFYVMPTVSYVNVPLTSAVTSWDFNPLPTVAMHRYVRLVVR